MAMIDPMTAHLAKVQYEERLAEAQQRREQRQWETHAHLFKRLGSLLTRFSGTSEQQPEQHPTQIGCRLSE
jgi:hypothetical protein